MQCNRLTGVLLSIDVLGRLCPGRKLADHTLWLAIVTVLAVLDINKAHDADGNEIMPEAAFVSGGIRYVHFY